MKKGWLVNDRLTCIPGTRTFWHDLLDWVPNLEDKCNEYTPFNLLADKIEMEARYNPPDYIIRNATYFRPLNLNIKTISLLQDITNKPNAANSSDIVVFNSPYTYSKFKNSIKTKSVIIPLGTNFNLFNKTIDYSDELGILPNSILFIGESTINPKGFDILLDIIEHTNYNFCLVMKDNYSSNNKRVKVFNKISHDILVKVINSCKLLLCTSREETLHLSGIEAAACNIPLVTSNVGLYFSLTNGSWGRKVLSFNYIDYIKEIKYVLDNLNEFSPREEFLSMGLDLNTCKQKWLNLIGEI